MKKARGADGISGETLKYCKGNSRQVLKEIVRRVWRGEGVPRDWRKAIIVPILKKGDVEDARNYRGISVLCAAYKVYASVLNERLKNDLTEKEILPDTQAGFRKSRSTIDNVYIIQHIVQREMEKKRGKVYAFFIDLKSAFDKVSRRDLWKSMKERGIRRGIVERIKELYEETENVIRIGDKYTKTFWTEEGVRQGCTLSPVLFTLFMADLEEVLKKGQDGGMVVGDKKFWSLMYADDIVLIASKEEELKSMIIRLERYLDKRKLLLNVEKSKVLVFSKGGGGRRKTEWRWKDKVIEEVRDFNYLGITLTKCGSLKGLLKERLKKANIVMRQIWGIAERKFKDDKKGE